ncbi:MAG: FAD-dependent oxidoreductase [Desulfosalsimonas sp.]|uniref:FAD-dependent oxidoreductase n=1 Tax=Desulfosalsimonas sp. TaxID=3073848 RepID=UPI003970F1E6
MELLLIGGSDAGISAALAARQINPAIRPTIVLADQYPNFSICGLPFYLSGEVGDWKTLAHRDLAAIEAQGITVKPGHRCTAIDPIKKTASLNTPSGDSQTMAWDKLVLCTGARSTTPQIDGLDLPGVFCLRWMDDAFVIEEFITLKKPKSIIIIGAGYIGMEIADAMTRRGLAVTVMEYAPSVLSTLDPDMGGLVRSELENNGVTVLTGISAKGIRQHENRLVVDARPSGGKDIEVAGDMVLVATGARPQTEPGLSAGIETGFSGAIRVNSRMETNLADIYAAGDCAETRHRLLDRNLWLPLGTTAHKQGKVAGENAAGKKSQFAGCLGTQCVKIFSLVAARTGLKQSEAEAEGFSPLSADIRVPDHKAYYPGAKDLCIRITGDAETGKLLGAQIVGAHGTEVSKRIDIFAAALHHFMGVNEICDLDLSYTPPLSSPWDPVQMAAAGWEEMRAEKSKPIP